MTTILTFYIFLSSILIWIGIKYLFIFLTNKYPLLQKYIYITFINWLSIINLLYIIPISKVYNNDPFNSLIYAFIWIFIYAYLSYIENKDKTSLQAWNDTLNNNIEQNNFVISDALLFISISSIYIFYIIMLYFFNLSFYQNILLGDLISLVFINSLLLSIFFIFNKNKIKYDIISLCIIWLIWGIEGYLFSNTNVTSYFLPNISSILQSLLWFFSIFYITYIIYNNKLINTYFIITLLFFFILWKIYLIF